MNALIPCSVDADPSNGVHLEPHILKVSRKKDGPKYEYRQDLRYMHASQSFSTLHLTAKVENTWKYLLEGRLNF